MHFILFHNCKISSLVPRVRVAFKATVAEPACEKRKNNATGFPSLFRPNVTKCIEWKCNATDEGLHVWDLGVLLAYISLDPSFFRSDERPFVVRKHSKSPSLKFVSQSSTGLISCGQRNTPMQDKRQRCWGELLRREQTKNLRCHHWMVLLETMQVNVAIIQSGTLQQEPLIWIASY